MSAPAATAPDPNFPTTSWSLIQEMASSDPEAARLSLGSLVEQYRYAIYVFIRSYLKCSHEDAEDHLQSFLIHLLERSDLLTGALPGQGRLRSYLLTILTHFLSNERRKTHAAKRDPRKLVHLDALDAAERYKHEPVQFLEPSTLYDREWARSIIDQALSRARARWGNRLPAFDELLPHLSLEQASSEEDISVLTRKHARSPDAIRMALSRLRRIWREELLGLIKTTLNLPTDEEAKTELSYLLGKI